jgi:hypothetical protein
MLTTNTSRYPRVLGEFQALEDTPNAYEIIIKLVSFTLEQAVYEVSVIVNSTALAAKGRFPG